mmetsp:Transcript_23187/g.92569  ORF Transcript_23187/g.92569 Transcript_23187/m.92569 type:complete len:130 (-) Transcript_23187:259-648(-)
MDILTVTSGLDEELDVLSETEREKYEKPCDNCGRLAHLERSTFTAEEGSLYCGQNCYWSKALDKANTRLRAGKKLRKRVKTTEEGGAGMLANQKAGIVQDSFTDSSNALFVYHAYFCGAYSLRTKREYK